jgi:hypothetical protein
MHTTESTRSKILRILKLDDVPASAPDEDWMGQHFRGDDLFEEIETAVSWFKAARR